METLENIVKEHSNDTELGGYLRANRDRLNDPYLNLAMEIYPNDMELGKWIRNLGIKKMTYRKYVGQNT